MVLCTDGAAQNALEMPFMYPQVSRTACRLRRSPWPISGLGVISSVAQLAIVEVSGLVVIVGVAASAVSRLGLTVGEKP